MQVGILKVLAFLINQKSKCLAEAEVKNLFINKVLVDESVWRNISNELNLFIAKSNIGYISYVDSYYIDSNNGISILKQIIEKQFVKQHNKLFDNNGINSYIYSYQNHKSRLKYPRFLEFLNNMRIYSYIRVYNVDDFWTVVPFVYLPTITLMDMANFANSVLNGVECFFSFNDEKIKGLIKEISFKNPSIDNNSNENKAIFLYKILTFLLSKIVLKIFIEDHIKSTKLISDNHGILCQETFVQYYIDINNFGLSNKKNKSRKKRISSYDKEIKDSEISKCVELFKESFDFFYSMSNGNDNDVLNKSLLEYLFKMRKEDQRRADNSEERLEGIRAEDIDRFYKNHSDSVRVSIINSWDSGDGSGVPRIFGTQNNKCISTSLINGEQIYKYIFDLYEQVTYDFKIFYNNTYISDFHRLKGFASYMDQCLKTKKYSCFLSLFERYGDKNDIENGMKTINIVAYNRVSNCNYKYIMDYIMKGY